MVLQFAAVIVLQFGRSSFCHSLCAYGLVCGLALGCTTPAYGFSLLGPYAPWMTPQIGFALPGDVGGPMNLGEEYRWNVPVLTYAFDPSFVEYFGSNGVAAVESAIAILNALPPVSQDNPTNYPGRVTLMNWQAEADGLFDLKSQTLASLLEQLGLATPSRFTFCVRNFAIVNNQPQTTVVERNFDPYSWSPSNQVDDVAYSYNLVYGPGTPPASVDAVEYAIDPLSVLAPAVADGALTAGALYSGLTLDDAAGLRYLIHTNNRNFEPLLADVHGAGTNAGAYVDQAARSGVDKIAFVRPPYDPLSEHFFTPYTNQFIDTYLAGSTPTQQQLERVVTQPDILFSSAGLSNGAVPGLRVLRTGTTNWLSLAAPGAAGPGIIRPSMQIVFQRPEFLLETADSLTDNTMLIKDLMDYRWGSFDVSSNAPVVYPVDSAPPMTNQFNVELELLFANGAPTFFNWQLPVPLGSQATIQTSTNLTQWETVLPVINQGRPLTWHHTVSQARRYFRVLSQ